MHRAEDRIVQRYHECEERVRQSPGNSILAAVLAGYFLHSVPVAMLLGGLTRLALALVRPLLFLYIAAKAFELLQRRAPTLREREEKRAPVPTQA